jgi:hypothetical protein
VNRPIVSCVDRPLGGVPITLRWKKHRLVCPDAMCPERSFTLGDHRIAAVGCRLSTRAANWVAKQIAGVDPAPEHGVDPTPLDIAGGVDERPSQARQVALRPPRHREAAPPDPS